MIDTVVSVKLPIGEMLRIKRNRLMPDVVTGEEKRICLVSGIYGDELGGQYICGEIIRRIKAEFENLTGIVDVYPAVNPLGLDARTRAVPISDIDYSSAFPGDINGGLEDYTAAKLIEDIKGASCCIDIHSSNIFLQEVPQVRLNNDYDETLLHLSKYMNTDLVWIHPSQTVNEGSLAHFKPDGNPNYGYGIRCSISYPLRVLPPDHRWNFFGDDRTWYLEGKGSRQNKGSVYPRRPDLLFKL
jgi:hypothetical protein